MTHAPKISAQKKQLISILCDEKHCENVSIREVKHASFTPLVMSTTEGLAHEATSFYKCLASLYLPSGEIVMASLPPFFFAVAFCHLLPPRCSVVIQSL